MAEKVEGSYLLSKGSYYSVRRGSTWREISCCAISPSSVFTANNRRGNPIVRSSFYIYTYVVILGAAAKFPDTTC